METDHNQLFGWSLFQMGGQVVPRTYRLDDKTLQVMDKDDPRYKRAKAADNGGSWWFARSDHSVDMLEDMFFFERDVSGLLYQRVGGIIGCPDLDKLGYVYIQVRFDPKDNSDVVRDIHDCLKRICVVLEHKVEFYELQLKAED